MFEPISRTYALLCFSRFVQMSTGTSNRSSKASARIGSAFDGVIAVLANPVLPFKTADVSTLFCEFAHRVINEYTEVALVLSVAASEVQDPKGRDVLLAAVGRLQAFSTAHSALRAPASNHPIDAAGYLKLAIEKHLRSRGLLEEGGAMVSLDALEIDSIRAWYLALIATELVNNALRHGTTGGDEPIQIQLQRQHEFATLSVSNGCASENVRTMGTGCSVIRELATALNGYVYWRFGPHSTTAKLTFAIQPANRAARGRSLPRREVPDFHF